MEWLTERLTEKLMEELMERLMEELTGELTEELTGESMGELTDTLMEEFDAHVDSLYYKCLLVGPLAIDQAIEKQVMVKGNTCPD